MKEELNLENIKKKQSIAGRKRIQRDIRNGYGTGKTITSLLAAKDYNEKVKNCVTVIVVPFQHLVNQWQKILILF